MSTRLIWIQIDDRNPTITDEFYAGSLYFKHHLSARCSDGLDPGFPHQYTATQALDPQATVSPGLVASLWLFCQTSRVKLEAIASLAPHLMVVTTFVTALGSRLATSNWVAGLVTASVVLSRGSIAQGPHRTGTYIMLHSAVSVAMVISLAWARSRDRRLLPLFALSLGACVLISTLFALTALPLLCFMGIYLFKAARESPDHASHRMSFFWIVSALAVMVALVCLLYLKFPASTLGIRAFLHQILQLTRSPQELTVILGAAIAEMESQDFHWLVSLAIITLALTFRKHLPHGSGLWAGMLLLMATVALSVDGIIITAAARHTNQTALIHFLNMREAVFSLEPLIIGAGAGYGWMAVRKLLMALIPSYSRGHRVRDRVLSVR